MLENMYVITMISNPVRYASRYNLYRKFAGVMKDTGVKFVTIEIAFGDRPFEVTERNNPFHIQLRTVDELWHKENALNIAINYIMQLDPDAKQVAWIDADVMPMRPMREWLEETVQELQHYQFVQMFDTAIDLDPDNSVMGRPQIGFISQYIKQGFKPPTHNGAWRDYYNKTQGHPGYAWAANLRDGGLASTGGLISEAILGAGDRHMACALVGTVEQSVGFKNEAYLKRLLQWQERCTRWVKRDVGFVKGSIFHFWHGSKTNRGYHSRWQILEQNQYNPDTDIKADHQGLLQLETWDPRQMMLRDQIRAYFRARNEDCIMVNR